MKRKKQARLLALWLLLAALLTACGSKDPGSRNTTAATVQTETAAPTQAETTAPPAETTAAETEPPAPSEETTEAAAEVDRYEEIIDRSADDGKFVLYFLDISTVANDTGEHGGDATILISPDGKVMLLDAGIPAAGDIVVSVLKDLGIEKIDYLVTSHPHIDHVGGVPKVLDAIPVEQSYRSFVEYTTQTWNNYVNAVEKHGIPNTCLKTGDTLQFGDQVTVEILGPDEEIEYPEGFPENSTMFLNNNSLVMKFIFGESTALFCGDLYIAQEREYIDLYGDALHVTVAKANHHGYATSNVKKWIKTVDPKIVVAIGDEMGSMDAYNNYVKQGSEYHHTMYDGVVKVILDDQGNVEVIDQFDSWVN